MWRRTAIIAVQALYGAWLVCSGPISARGPEVPDVTIAHDAPGLKNVNGVLLVGREPFSGRVEQRIGDRLVARTPYLHGKQHGVVEGWYGDGSPRHRRIYRDGRREGTHYGYWPDGSPQFVYHYEHDRFEGEQVAFYKNGVEAERRHYREGREDGTQRFYDGSGRLIGNYTFRNGRRYGIVGRMDCTSMGAGL